jgi:hypothetical protein
MRQDLARAGRMGDAAIGACFESYDPIQILMGGRQDQEAGQRRGGTQPAKGLHCPHSAGGVGDQGDVFASAECDEGQIHDRRPFKSMLREMAGQSRLKAVIIADRDHARHADVPVVIANRLASLGFPDARAWAPWCARTLRTRWRSPEEGANDDT